MKNDSKRVLATVLSITGEGGTANLLFRAYEYVSGQFTENGIYGLLLIIVILSFLLLFCIFFIKPLIISVIEWVSLTILHSREVSKQNNNQSNHTTTVREEVNKLLEDKVAQVGVHGRKNIDNDEQLGKIIDLLSEKKKR
ncbi:MAG: hypothetical protein J1F31_07055 [Erysipelotrichales bacterium]|nr:hypothetical protein [Erysipelotrichales bacterium]